MSASATGVEDSLGCLAGFLIAAGSPVVAAPTTAVGEGWVTQVQQAGYPCTWNNRQGSRC